MTLTATVWGMNIANRDDLKPSWGALMTIGIALIILGALSIGVSLASTLVTVVFLGAVFAAGGIAQIFHAFSAKGWVNVLLYLAIGILYLIAGVVMVARPVMSAVSLTLFLGVLFMVSGIFRSVGAVWVRYPSWGWSLASGLITLAVGLMVLRGLPSTGLWVIGTFLGVDLIFAGAATTSMASAARRLTERREERRENWPDSALPHPT